MTRVPAVPVGDGVPRGCRRADGGSCPEPGGRRAIGSVTPALEAPGAFRSLPGRSGPAELVEQGHAVDRPGGLVVKAEVAVFE